MATYSYRCVEHGLLDVARPMGTAAEREPCPACGAAAVRVFTAPRLAVGGSASARALIERTERSADQPAIVSAPPSRTAASSQRPPAPAAARNPALARLPRP